MIKEKIIYRAIIDYCEKNGDHKDNAHHFAQELSLSISGRLLPKQQKAILNMLTTVPQSTKEIATQMGLTTKYVSAQLKQITDKTSLVLSTIKPNGDKSWFIKL